MRWIPVIALALTTQDLCAQSPVRVHGELRRWHKVTVDIDGPAAAEDGTPNPFLDYRLVVTFRHAATNTSYAVPGYFAADGRAAETSADAGRVWRAHLCPDHTGTWSYAISMRGGADVAVSTSAGAGAPVAGVDGLGGTFAVQETDKSGRDHRAPEHGRLRYVGRHHLQFAGGRFFLKAGSDSPENLLAFDDFDNTPDTGGLRKAWAAHVADWRPGEPSWQGGKGKGLVGAVDSMARAGMNAMSFLTYSYNGDDKNVFPYRDPTDRLRLDCSKLDQWEVVFAHMDRQGIYLHFKTQETENDQDHDGGQLGRERRLYYRELIARFGHHLALNWNLGEENSNTDAQRKAFAQFFADHDPYRHHVVVHTFPNEQALVYTPLLGAASMLTGASVQSGLPSLVFAETLTWRTKSAAAGRAWVVACDEQGPADVGVLPDSADPDHDAHRAQVLWGNLMAGGAGIESYFGYRYPHSDLTCEDLRSRARWWDQCRHALDVFRDQLVPVQDMANADALVSRGRCLAGASELVVYLPGGAPATLDLTGRTGGFEVSWFDPRQGGGLQSGAVTAVAGGGVRGLGAPPSTPTADWVVLVRPGAGAARVASYGVGCAGTDGWVPHLAAARLPVLGDQAFALQVRDGRAASAALLLLGTTRADAPLPTGCTMRVGNLVGEVLVPTDTQGTARVALPIPNLNSLLGVEVFATAGVLDPGGAFAGVAAVTQGLRLVLGR